MLPRRALIFLFVAWALVSLYPDPNVLIRSVRDALSPPIHPWAVAALARRLPNDPKAIETYVLQWQVPYAYDWQTAGVPWYFPSTREALKAGEGDCESRAVVLASILTAKRIPNHLYMSLDHIWVEYPGKHANSLENPGVRIAGRQDGRWFFHLPRMFNLGREWEAQVGQYVTPAPLWRVVAVLVGLSLALLWNALARVLGAGRLAADGLLPGPRDRRRLLWRGRRTRPAPRGFEPARRLQADMRP